MKKIIAAMIFQASVLVVAAQSKTQAPPLDHKYVIGVWQGSYELDGVNKSLTIEFKEANGQLECYIDIPERGIKNAKFKIRYCPARDFHLERTSTEKTQLMDNTYVMFVGKPNGEKMTGHYKFGNSCTAGPTPTFSVERNATF